ncbi:hypothetical protein [Saccharothrix coeruleofusca]|uniref:Uncharacterized protein n=1 Tax=Saccharothrix coeruleofusca TaxID=33919 RepID=A0A918ECY9_9PSEU|nr:hypothetical protein [Saccharothrix coeruleofusca]GGP43786.1 hypothetical protein GCM10010185_14350 [Saccharothrix coeruleofusca]
MSRKTHCPKRWPIAPVGRPHGTPLTLAQREVVRRCRALPQLTDPLEIELVVSHAVSDVPVDEEFWAGVIEHAVSLPTRRNEALLRALAALLTGRPREWAARAAPPLPPELVVGEAWICDRSIDAGYLALICSYSYGVREHAMVFLVDELAGGMVRKAFVTRDVAVALVRLSEQGPLEQVAPAAAHWLLSKSYDRLDRQADLAVDVEVWRTRLLAGRRIALAFG